MLAVIKTGGKQYIVKKGDVLDIEKVPGEPGDSFEFSDVLLTSNGKKKIKVGSPVVEKAKVTAKILDEQKGPKITVFKFKRRKGYRKKTGHRQKYTRVEITDIKV